MEQSENVIQININTKSSVPKYIQVVESIAKDISFGRISMGQKMPSINQLSESTTLSRDTIEKAYKYLRNRKLIYSVKGVGYYVTNSDPANKLKIVVFLNKPSTYKMDMFKAFVDAIGAAGQVALYLYNCDENLFSTALERATGMFDYYVLMPHFKSENQTHICYPENAFVAIQKIPKNKLLILDNLNPDLKGDYGAVYQDFKRDLFHALEQGVKKLQKYKKIILVYPVKSVFPYPKQIIDGFIQFCHYYNFDYEILDDIYQDLEFKGKEAFITIQESHLVELVQQIRNKKLKIGKDIGVISYNETPLKALLGITVVSTDFIAMGQTAAELILSNKKDKIKNEFKYIERKSL